MEQPKEYYAFISYKREDEKWAKWLQDKLEHYRFPTNLNGRTDLPKNIRPTFRDVTDLKPGLLAEEINNALQNSEWLIVVCSPRSAKSPWVCKEAQTFIDLGRADRIIPFVIEGNPFSDNIATECYPEALLNLTGSKELLAANINEMGRDAAAIKVVARMFNLRFDALWQRCEREKRKKMVFMISGILSLLIMAIGVALWIGYQNILLKERDWKMMENQARAVAEKAKELIDNGDSYLARLLLLEILPKNISTPNRPLVPEAEVAIRRAIHAENAVLTAHNNDVSSLQFSNDGSKLYSASWDGVIFVWDVLSGSLLKRIDAHSDYINEILLTHDGEGIISASNDSTIKLWDASSGFMMGYIKENGRVFTIKQSPDCRFFVSGTGKEVHIWDNLLEESLEPHKRYKYDSSINTIAFAPNSRDIILSMTDEAIECRNLYTNSAIWTVNSLDDDVTSIDFSKDGGQFITSSIANGVFFRDSYTGTIIRQINPGWISNVRFSPKTNKYVAMAFFKDNYDSNVLVAAFRNGQIEKTLTGHSGYIRCLTFSPDESILCSGGGDRKIRLWDMLSHASFEGRGHRDHIQSIAFSHNGEKIITTSDDKTVKVWDVETTSSARPQFSLKGHSTRVTSAIFSNNDSLIASASVSDKTVIIWDANNGVQKRKLRIGKRVLEMAFNRNDSLLATTIIGDDNNIYLWDVNKGNLVKTFSSRYSPSSISFSSDGKVLYSLSYGSISMWNICSGKIVKEVPIPIFVTSSTFSPDNKFVVGLNKDKIFVYEVASGILQKTIGDVPPMYSVSISHDPKYIIGNSINEGSVYVWDLFTGSLVMNQYSNLDKATFTPEGNAIAASWNDSIVRIYPFPSLQKIIDETRERFKNRHLTLEERKMYYLE